MPDVDEGLARVEQRLDSLAEHIDQRFARVDQRFGSLEAEVQKLRVLGEDNAAQIRVIAEVQAHHASVHGAALERLEKAVEPLKAVAAALESILPDHERRIRTLEDHMR
jgi:prefoldin subunit 5